MNPVSARKYKARAAGFTLIEILLVVVIIGILAAAAVPRLGGRTRQAEIARTRSDLDNIGTAISLYELDNGEYPRSLQDLITQPAHARNWQGPYLDRGMPLDPWGQEYTYTYPGVHNPGRYDLRSLGPDGVESDADIKNWR